MELSAALGPGGFAPAGLGPSGRTGRRRRAWLGVPGGRRLGPFPTGPPLAPGGWPAAATAQGEGGASRCLRLGSKAWRRRGTEARDAAASARERWRFGCGGRAVWALALAHRPARANVIKLVAACRARAILLGEA